MNPNITLLRAVVSSPQQTPSQVSALSVGLHKGLTKHMLIVDIHCLHPGPEGLDHIPFNQVEQADVYVSITALRAG